MFTGTFHTQEDILEFASLGSYCEYDLFGMEVSHYQLQRSVDMISDAQRIQRVKWLIEAGFEDRVLISHDIHAKHMLMKYGGYGYSHILMNIVPKMLERGISQETIDKIIVANPQRWLTFK
ncbi:Phosphotriesterase-related protein [Lamellibrachia satsuma]|nr:Phosphotriesterase-related protein [Lamellibrachia satsuma]